MHHARLARVVALATWLSAVGPGLLPAQSVMVRLPPVEDEAAWDTPSLFRLPPPPAASAAPLPTLEELPSPNSVVVPLIVDPPPESGLPESMIAPPLIGVPLPSGELPSGPLPNSPPQPVVQGPWTTGLIGGGGPLGAGMMGRGPLIGGNVHGAWFAPERVSGQAAQLGYVQETLGITAPIYQGKQGMLFFNSHLFSEQISTTAILPTSGRAFPNQLWSMSAGVGGMRRFDSGWTAMANVSLGSASDQLFSAGTTTVSMMTMLRVPRGPRNAWQFSLMYSNNSPLPIPIPGVAYAYSPSPRLFMMIGLPPSIVYRPTDKIVLEASYMPIYNAHAKATYIHSPTLRFYSGFDWENQTYFLRDRPVQNDRFFYFDERLSTGGQQLLGKHWVLDFSGGYLFNRYFYQATSSTAAQTDRVNIGAGPYAAVFLNARY
jgi:hypothetical protein